MTVAGYINVIDSKCTEWNIPNFFHFCFPDQNKTYFSPEFTINGYKWNLVLKIEPNSHSSLSLQSNNDEMISVWYIILVLNPRSNKLEVVNPVTTYTFSVQERYGDFDCTKQMIQYCLKNKDQNNSQNINKTNFIFTVRCNIQTSENISQIIESNLLNQISQLNLSDKLLKKIVSIKIFKIL